MNPDECTSSASKCCVELERQGWWAIEAGTILYLNGGGNAKACLIEAQPRSG